MLEIDDLHIDYFQAGRPVPAVRGVSFTILPGRSTAIVGESGSGKSTLALAIMGVIKPPIGRIAGGRVVLDGTDLAQASAPVMRAVLRDEIGFIPQDPTTALDPLFTVRSQISEVLGNLSRSEVDARVVELLTSLGVAQAADRLNSYPHEFSGGMKQRVAMAIALAKEPSLIIADEPTTALDVTTQLGILRLLDRLRRERQMSTLFITHDLRVARLVCQDVVVMYAGRVVECGPIQQIMTAPRHPYTRALLDSLGRDVAPRTRLRAIGGQPPAIAKLPAGCAFAERCPQAMAVCREQPPLEGHDGVSVACWKVAG